MNRRLDWARDAADWPLREASRFATAGGLRWHVQRLGQGPQVLMLHGTGASTHSWRALARLMAPHAELLMPDLPGHGFSEPMPAGTCSLPAMAAALVALCRQQQFSPRLVLGHSAGGALAIRMALDQGWTQPVLVGLNAALLPWDGIAGVLFPPMAKVLALNPFVPHIAAWRAQDPKAVQRLIASTGSTLDDEGLHLYHRLIRDPRHVAGALAMMADWDLKGLQQDLPGLRCPLHLIAASGDTTVPPEQAARVAASLAGRVTLHRLTGLGHLAHEEAPARVARMLRRVTARACTPGEAPAPTR